MKTIVGLATAFVLIGAPAWAAGPAGAPPSAAVADPAVPSDPQQTSASFGDWVVRCERPPQVGAGRICEAAQALVIKGQQGPIAQIAFGHAPHDKGGDPNLMLTVLLPVSISLDKTAKLGPGPAGDDPAATTLTFRRCLPGGCFADAKADPALMKALRSTTKPGHLTFADAAERTLSLPISFRGLPQALDQLARDTAKDGGQAAGH